MAAVNGFLTTPDLITQIIVVVLTFGVILGILFTSFSFVPVTAWPQARQGTFIWLVAAGGIVVSSCIFSLTIRLLNR